MKPRHVLPVAVVAEPLHAVVGLVGIVQAGEEAEGFLHACGGVGARGPRGIEHGQRLARHFQTGLQECRGLEMIAGNDHLLHGLAVRGFGVLRLLELRVEIAGALEHRELFIERNRLDDEAALGKTLGGGEAVVQALAIEDRRFAEVAALLEPRSQRRSSRPEAGRKCMQARRWRPSCSSREARRR